MARAAHTRGGPNIRRFDPRTMGDRKTAVIIGKRGTGKSVLAKDLMSYKQHLPAGVVMSGTEEGNGFYGKWIPSIFVYNQFDPDVVERVIEVQKAAIARDNKDGVTRRHDMFMIMDDCMYDRSVLREKCMRQVFMNGRHWHISLLLTAQYMMDMPPDIRTNVDYVFVLRENVIQNRRKLYDSFFGVFPTFPDFCAAMDACTEDNNCMVLDNTCSSNRLEDCIFFYKASMEHAGLRLCAPAAWALHDRHFDPRHEEPRRTVRLTAAPPRRRPAARKKPPTR